jgi:hypothetical protein
MRDEWQDEGDQNRTQHNRGQGHVCRETSSDWDATWLYFDSPTLVASIAYSAHQAANI